MKALVTGSSSTIGEKIIRRLLDEGYEVLGTSRTRPDINHSSFHFIKCDMEVQSEIDSLMKEVQGVDVYVNASGQWHEKGELRVEKNFNEFSLAEIRSSIEVNLLSVMLLTKHILDRMNPNGLIIFISGTFEDGLGTWTPYAVGKRAIEDFTVALSEEDNRLFINCLSPSYVASKAVLNYFGEYEDDCESPDRIPDELMKVLDMKSNGKIYVIEKGSNLREDFHY